MVSFEPAVAWGWEIVSMQQELEQILSRKVNFLTKAAVEGSHNWIAAMKFSAQHSSFMRRDEASLWDIYHGGRQILTDAQGLSSEELQADSMRISAILYQIVVIGEATKRLSSKFRTRYPAIPWSNMAGMREIVVHQYDRVAFQTVWNIIHSSIPELLAAICPYCLRTWRLRTRY